MEVRGYSRGLEERVDNPKKGNLKDCKNSRGIMLLSIVGKILGRIVIDRVRSGADKRLRKEQAGYRQGRGTAEQCLHSKEYHRASKRVASNYIRDLYRL